MKTSPSPMRFTHTGFALIEIMIVVAILAIVALVALPRQLRARQQSQAARVLDDLRTIDRALNRWASECDHGEMVHFPISNGQPVL